MRVAVSFLGLAFLIAACGGGSGANEDLAPTAAPVVAEPTLAPSAEPLPISDPADVTYENCDAVRAAGVAPIRVGEPGYSKKLDRDGGRRRLRVVRGPPAGCAQGASVVH
jgi:hypothetical protein